MKKIRLMILFMSILVLTGMHPNSALAEGDWSVKTDVQAMYGGYNGSPTRSSIRSGGVILSADYLDDWGFSIGETYTLLKFKAASAIKDINQQATYASLHYNVYLDSLPGPLSLRLDGHIIGNNDVTGDTDNVRVVAPQLSFLNYSKTFYVDMGYAYSKYKNNLTVQQFTPTVGFAFNNQADWIQVRGFFIKPSNALRAQNTSSTTAVDVKLTHWFAPASAFVPEKVQIGALLGERIYAVDGDAAAVYNLADVQRGSGTFNTQWKLPNDFSLMLLAGYEAYQNKNVNNNYSNRFAFVSISRQW